MGESGSEIGHRSGQGADGGEEGDADEEDGEGALEDIGRWPAREGRTQVAAADRGAKGLISGGIENAS